jgi:serine/threonine-protein kinase
MPDEPSHATGPRPTSPLADTQVRPEDILPSVAIPEGASTGRIFSRGPDPYLGTTIDGRYLVEKSIGEGGMGVVYRARHTVIDKKVAIKVLRDDMARDPEMTDRFLQEAKAASMIGNPHIVDISDFGRLPDGCAYFVMEYLDGLSLGEIIKRSRPIPVARLVHIAKQIAQGLSAAHAAGIVHRDLKPDNVHVIARGTDKDFVKVLDFGIAKVGGESARITRAGSVFGTPHYMSPEQAAGAPVDQRTDIYALGVILYEMAAGKVPFDADNFMGILTQHMYKAPVPIRALVPQQDIPAGLDAIVLKCLSKKPDSRYATMDDLVTDFEALEAGTMPRAVADMMARSGGFNVPVDYFRNPGGMPAPVPGMPAGYGRRSAARLYWVVALTASVLVAFLLVVIVREVRGAPSASAGAGTTSSVPTVPPTPATVVPVETTVVVVSVDPADAKVTRDGADLGSAPAVLHLAPGESATLTIARPGYVPQTLQVTAKEPRRTVKLAPTPGAMRPPVKAPNGTKPPPTASPISTDAFSDPWKNK